MKFKILDLFSGAGGFSYGLEMNENFKTVLACEMNESASKTFLKNHVFAEMVLGDITNTNIKAEIVEKAKFKKVNMIIGGPPCQGFSMKGKKMGLEDPRNFLFLEFIDLVDKIRPEVFIMENVKAMISSADGYFINEIINKFKKLNYHVNYKVLKSSDYGVPQSRERAIIIGSQTRTMSFPEKNGKTTTVYDAISDLNYLESNQCGDEKYITEPSSEYQELMRKDSLKPQWHIATKHSSDAIFKMSLIPENGTKYDLPVHLRTKQKFNTTWSRLQWNKPSPTIDTRFDTPSNGQNIHPVLNRAITPREAARIQSFPDKFEFVGSKTAVCKQIGNAVPPLMAKAIGDEIIKNYRKITEKSYGDSKVILADSYNYNISLLPFVDAIITDPPYNISQKNNFNTLRNPRKGLDFGEWDKNFDLTGWIPRYYEKLKPGGTIIIFGSFLYISYIANALTELGAEVKDLIKWTKTNPMPRNIERRYVLDSEFAVWAIKPGKWVFNKGDAPYKRAHYHSATVLGKERTLHPTQKSLRLMEELLLTHTNENQIVLDPFMGSGTTCLAAKNTNRKFIGIEINSTYFKIANDRLK